MAVDRDELSATLGAFQAGEPSAVDAMSNLVYKELRRLAAAQLRREAPGHTLQPTALVHEVYLRFANWQDFDFKSRAHFLAIAATLMRQVLVQHARTRNAAKRGGGRRRITLEEGAMLSGDGSPEVEALDDALHDLARSDARKSRIVEMRFFGGLTEAEIAEVLGISVTTVGREMRVALAMLHRSLRRSD